MSASAANSQIPHLQRFNGVWETQRLGDIGNCLRGVSYDPTTDLSEYDTDKTVRLLRANNIQDTIITISDIQHVHSRKVSKDQLMKPKDILVCMANGSKELVGKSAQFGAFMGCFRINLTIAEPEFALYLFQTRQFRNFVGVILAGSSINNLKPSDIESAEFHVPAKTEQKAIAEVLSDVDGLIRALDALIAKRRAIKQATMQQLLTGKTRLLGFNGEWRKTRIRDLLTYSRPDPYIVQCAEYSQHGDVPVLTANKSFVLGFTDELSGVCQDFPAIIFDDFTTASKYPTFPFKVKSSAIKLLYAKHERVSLKFVRTYAIAIFIVGDFNCCRK